jgi:hypothetical protein
MSSVRMCVELWAYLAKIVDVTNDSQVTIDQLKTNSRSADHIFSWCLSRLGKDAATLKTHLDVMQRIQRKI